MRRVWLWSLSGGVWLSRRFTFVRDIHPIRRIVSDVIEEANFHLVLSLLFRLPSRRPS